MKKLIGYFLQGLLYILPIVVTIYVIIALMRYVNRLLSGISFFAGSTNGMWIGLLLIIIIITIIGWLLPVMIKTPLVQFMQRTINSTPLVGIIYTSVKDLMSAFVGKKRKFGTPVLVSMDNEGIMHRLGFITQETTEQLGVEGMMAVYMPSSYGLLGDLVIVPESKVRKLDSTSADMMKFIVSGGVTKINDNTQQVTEGNKESKEE